MFLRGREVRFNLIGGRAFSRPNLYWFVFSGLLILMSLVALFTLGVDWGIEFEGGYLVKYQLEKEANVEEVRGIVSDYTEQGLDKTVVQTSEGGTILTLRMPYIENPDVRSEVIEEIQSRVDGLYGIVGDKPVFEEQVGPEWGREISNKALIALGVFLVVILIYITFRLEFKMAVPAIVALMHDTLITVGIYALTQRQVNPVTVIAFLTILGYSLYDTIVVFDRVEENSNLMTRSTKTSYADIVNVSVNQTLIRSINTTLTTLIPIITILVFGGETLKDFAFALFLGVLLGGYSSVFIAAPLLSIWKEREPRYAALREKAEATRGARESILVTTSRLKIEEAEEPEHKPMPKKEKKAEAAKKAAPQKAKKEPAKASSSKQGQRKKPTTKGPSGGKKKKKKKKKKK